MTLEDRLTYAGQERADAADAHREASQKLRFAMWDAAEAGVSKTRIAELAGVSRQTVHTMLKGEQQ